MYIHEFDPPFLCITLDMISRMYPEPSRYSTCPHGHLTYHLLSLSSDKTSGHLNSGVTGCVTGDQNCHAFVIFHFQFAPQKSAISRPRFPFLTSPPSNRELNKIAFTSYDQLTKKLGTHVSMPNMMYHS